MKKTQSEVESRVIVGAHGVAAEEDHIIMGKVVGIGVGSLLIFAVGIVWAVYIQVQTMKEAQPDGPPPRPVALGQYEVGIVNQRLFEQDWHATDKLSEQHQTLNGGWGDQPGVKAHTGIDEAMRQVVTDQGRMPAAPQTPPPSPTPSTPAHNGATPAPAPAHHP